MPPSPGEVTYVVRGASMSPTLRTLDVLVLSGREQHEYRSGDVIAFAHAGSSELVAHRIVMLKGESFRTRGDGSARHDRWVVESGSICGRVVGIVRDGRAKKVAGGVRGEVVGTVVWSMHRAKRLIGRLLPRSVKVRVKKRLAMVLVTKPRREPGAACARRGA